MHFIFIHFISFRILLHFPPAQRTFFLITVWFSCKLVHIYVCTFIYHNKYMLYYLHRKGIVLRSRQTFFPLPFEILFFYSAPNILALLFVSVRPPHKYAHRHAPLVHRPFSPTNMHSTDVLYMRLQWTDIKCTGFKKLVRTSVCSLMKKPAWMCGVFSVSPTLECMRLYTSARVCIII